METDARAPMMLFDGECLFCRGWIGKWRALTGPLVSYAPYQSSLSAYPQVTAAQCEEAVQLVMPDGSVFSGAHAVFKALAIAGKYGRLLRYYESFPLFKPVSEWCYQLVAHHRVFFSRLQR